MNFADTLHQATQDKKSFLLAGIDPRPDLIPHLFHTQASISSKTDSEYIQKLFFEFYSFALKHIQSDIVAVKPNIAFFEQYGLAGLTALKQIVSFARDLALPIILDAKRGDIGSTANAYAKAYLSETELDNRIFTMLHADAITVNPFLGFDTVESFTSICKETGKGIFVLVRTSNPGSGDIQNIRGEDGRTISESIADWVTENGKALTGSCGISSLGAVVGATYPQELAELRQRMPNTFLLIPGYGAQGGSASELGCGFRQSGDVSSGAIINASRGLFSNFKDLAASKEDLATQITTIAKGLKDDLNSALPFN